MTFIKAGKSNIYRSSSSTGNRLHPASTTTTHPINVSPSVTEQLNSARLPVTDVNQRGHQLDYDDARTDDEDDVPDRAYDDDDYNSDDMPASGDVRTVDMLIPASSSSSWSRQYGGMSRGSASTRRPSTHAGAQYGGQSEDASQPTTFKHRVIGQFPGVVATERGLAMTSSTPTPKQLMRKTTGSRDQSSRLDGNGRMTSSTPTSQSALGRQRRPVSSPSTSASRRHRPVGVSSSTAVVFSRTRFVFPYLILNIFVLLCSVKFDCSGWTWLLDYFSPM